ncbi:DUF305 domain-containing protein [Amycolatopsis albispora]|uniref:DUF305 domain-containing protein n=1 Tax=Amycolatopsis albispora TaxID=1804986 RepID=A0A344L0M8_9PSEU|nr:DUF305 domain-containing protein [Amycolatopsis albispora]AXB41602.1 DUF305 domain-containing protein [Amycolatopsis albispora]
MKKYLVTAASAAAITLLAACGGTTEQSGVDSAPSAQQVSHNQQDITFAQQMIPHHQQAVDMAELAADRAADPRVKELATRIQGAQDPEIQQLTGMLNRWGAPAPSAEMDHGSDHGAGMEGMMSGEEMQQLHQSSGAEFDRAWVSMMIRHHQGAVDMANTELQQGSDAEAKALAQQIVTAQDGEIRELQAMLPQ